MPRVSLPSAVPLLAALGLAILVLCTWPAVRTQQRLEQEARRLRAETRAAEAEVERLQRELRDGTTQHYLRVRARQELLRRGSRYVEERDERLGRKPR